MTKPNNNVFTLHAFADATGGRTCATFAELGKCFAAVVDDSRDFYLLASTSVGTRNLDGESSELMCRRTACEFDLARNSM